MKSKPKFVYCNIINQIEIAFKILHMFRKFLQKIRNQGSEALLSLIGALIINLGMGTIGTWSTSNLYVFSYFHYLGYRITPSTNSLILLSAVIPMSVFMLLATKLCKKFGQKKVMVTGSFVFLLSPLFVLIDTLEAFVFFLLVMPASMFSLITVPCLSSIWSQYPKAKSKVTAAVAIAIGLGTMLWNSVFTHTVNPDNQSILQPEEGQKMGFFKQQVVKNIKQVAIICFMISGGLSLIGSIMMKSKNSLKQNGQQNQNYEQQIDDKVIQPVIDTEQKNNQIMVSSINQKRYQSVSDVFRETSFILMIIYILIACLFQVQVVLNLKIVYLPLIKDDHFLTYCIIILAFVGVTSAYAWGVICDRKGIGFCMLLLVILDTFLKIFSFFAKDKATLILLMIFVGLQTKALGTFVAPGWAELYGLKIGTQLIPYKGIAFILGFIIAPFLQVLTSSIFNPSQYLNFLALTCIFTTPIGLRFYFITKDLHSSMKQSASQEELK